MALPLSPLSEYATVESSKAPQTMQAYICIKLHNITRLKYLIGTFTSLASVYRMIVFVIVPPGNLGNMYLFMPNIEDGNVVRPSHYSTPSLR